MAKEDTPNRQQMACDFINEQYVAFRRLRFDTIAQKIQIREDTDASQPWRYITNADINTMVCDCCHEKGPVTVREILTVLNAGTTYIPHVHPLREYVLSCRPWQGEVDWIDFIAQQVCVCDTTSTAYSSEACERSHVDRLWRLCFKKWFVAMVASWMRDEVVNHQVLVLIGKQGIYKTTWLEHLIPPHLRAYCCKLANANQLTKDDRLRIAEFGLINLDELDAMTPRELNQMKSIITATDVNERAAYAYTKERRVRLASFCASGNRRDFLTDITGNRRWLPFEVESIQSPFHTQLPYERMYAEAWALANDEFFSYWFDLDEIEVLEQHNQHFRDESNEEQLLDVYFAVPAREATNTKFLTTAEISERLIYYGNIKRPLSLSRLGVLLSQKGFLSIRKGSPQRRGWIVYERDNEEVNAERRILSKT